MKQKLVVMGHGGHGKDTVCEILRDEYGYTFQSSSRFALESFLWSPLRFKFGYNDIEECYADRRNKRSIWFEMIKHYNKKDPTRLAKSLFNSYDVYCGVRNSAELEGMKDEALYNVAVWVDASQRLPIEAPDSITVSPGDVDWVINNNGNILDLHKEVDKFAAAFTLF